MNTAAPTEMLLAACITFTKMQNGVQDCNLFHLAPPECNNSITAAAGVDKCKNSVVVVNKALMFVTLD